MGIRKLNTQEEIQYLKEVQLYLKGKDPSEDILLLPDTALLLIQARQALRKGDYQTAQALVNRVLNFKDEIGWLAGDAEFILGNIYYDLNKFLEAAVSYAGAMKSYKDNGKTERQLKAQFNHAQCLDELGKFNEANEERQLICQIASQLSYDEIRANCLRSFASQYLAQGERREAFETFHKASVLFFVVGNESDGQYAFLSACAISIADKTIEVDSLFESQTQRIFASPANIRSYHMINFLIAITNPSKSEQDLSKLTNLIKTCDVDFQDLINGLQLISRGRSLGLKRKGPRTSFKLIEFLQKKKEASKEELIRFLWPNQEYTSQHEQRLWTAISRANKNRKLVDRNENGHYFLREI